MCNCPRCEDFSMRLNILPCSYSNNSFFFSLSKDTHKRNVIPHYEVLKLGSSCDGISQYVAFNDLTHTL